MQKNPDKLNVYDYHDEFILEFRPTYYELKKAYKQYFSKTIFNRIDIYKLHLNKSRNLIYDKLASKILDIKTIYNETHNYGILIRQQMFVFNDEAIVVFDWERSKLSLIYGSFETENYLNLTDELIQFKTISKRKKGKLKILIKDGSSLSARSFSLSKKSTDIDLHYNEDFRVINNSIVEKLSVDNSKGIVLLHGAPGTGKTSYIRHLSTILNKDILFLPPELCQHLTGPALIGTLLSFKNSILIIEDAEKLIVNRNTSDNSIISALLNITDGLLSDILNIQVICTFNTDLKNVDSALLRKGRLLASYYFKALVPEKANKLSKSIGINKKYNNATKLVDVLFDKEDTFWKTEERKAVGFNN